MFIACELPDDSSPQRGDMFRAGHGDKEGLKQTAEFVDVVSEELWLTRATAMNMSPRWGEEPLARTVGYKHVTPLE